MKSYFCTAVLSVCAIMTFAASSVAEQTSPWNSSSNQPVQKHFSNTFKQSIPSITGKYLTISEWNGMGNDISQHPDGPRHNPVTCGICN